MDIKVMRTAKEPGYTIGHLIVRDLSLWTMEDAVREVAGAPVCDWKQYGCTAIPAGRYQVVVTYSNRFKRELPLLVGVEGFTGVRIHAGNSAEDTEGCLLVGMGTNGAADRITDSRTALAKLMDVMDDAYAIGDDVWLEIA